MTVYVDDAEIPFNGMKMNHMIADTEGELHEMADAIGLKRDWYQGDHYDVSISKKKEAVERGAEAISWRELPQIEDKIHRQRNNEIRNCPRCGNEPTSVDPKGPLRSCGACNIVYHQDGTVVA